jgi:broad specificity phosphatase PhoE
MRTAILTRHGETEFSVRGAVNGDPAGACPLTAEGISQARRLGRMLAGDPIDLCVTSEFPRAIETADVALIGRDVPRLVLPELNDPRPGAFEGRALVDYRQWARSAPSDEVPPGDGESRVELVGRYARGYRRILELPEPVVLVVGHSLATAYVLEALQGRDPAPAIPLVPYAEPHYVEADELEQAIARLETWSLAPTW